VTDAWVPSPPPVPPVWVPPLPPANGWNEAQGCSPGPNQPAIADSIILTGNPATITSMPWVVSVNDGASPSNFSVDHYDSSGNFIDSPLLISGVDGSVLLAQDPTQPLGAATKEYVDSHAGGGDVEEAPEDNYPYARYMGGWTRLPQSYIPEAPGGQLFARFNGTWSPVPIQADAPSDGGTYGRQNGAWNPALATAGGTVTGSLTVNQVLTVQGSNSLVLNAPLGGLRGILGMAANVARWSLALGDSTTEGLNNVGANFTLSAYSTTGAFLGNWLTIARANGAAVFGGPVTMNAGLGVNGSLALSGPGNLILLGGNPGDFLQTNGLGVLAWAPAAGGGGGIPDAPADSRNYARYNNTWAPIVGFPEAPADGTAYARKSLAWAHLTHTDITDWTTALASYATTAQLANYVPLAGGNMTGTLFLPYDPVVPLAAATKQYVDNKASTTLPLADGTAAIGAAATFALADHVHPASASGAGKWQQIASQTVTGAPTTINFTGLPQTYGDLLIVANGIGVTSAGGPQIFLDVSTDNGTTYSPPPGVSLAQQVPNTGLTSFVAIWNGYTNQFGIVTTVQVGGALPASPGASIPNPPGGANALTYGGLTVHTGGSNALRIRIQTGGTFVAAGTITIFAR
jgi:hypothetical protein